MRDFIRGIYHSTLHGARQKIFEGGVALKLRARQNELTFPRIEGVEEFRSPDQYEQLSGLDVSARKLTSKINGNVPITIWEKAAKPGMPHYLLFHGQCGHWGDTGPAKEGEETRTARLRFLKAIADQGAGFTAVGLEGFGGETPGTPSEAHFNKDIRIVLNYLLNTKKLPHDQIIVGGESMGAACALEAAAQMTERTQPPAQVDLANPFTSFAKVAEERHVEIPLVKQLGIHLSARFINFAILKNHFDNMSALSRLTPFTQVHIGISELDTTIPNHHSTDLANRALNCRPPLSVTRTLFPGANHRNWPPELFIEDSLSGYRDHMKSPFDGVENPPGDTHVTEWRSDPRLRHLRGPIAH